MTHVLVVAGGGPVIPNYGKATGCIADNGSFFCTTWIRQHWGDTLQPALVQHIELALIAIGIGFVLAFGLARALAADPPLLLMDEPFSAIDPIVRARLQDEFLRLQREVRKTVVFVTHDVDEAIKIGDRMAILREGGKLAQYDAPATILQQPADDFVAEFVGADRALKALALRTLADVPLRPPHDGAPRLPSSTTLRDALALLIAERRETLTVTDEAGTPLGSVALEDLLR